MSFLTPLYLLGGLAIALPILAHLIRRTPPRRREFSSVMFLTPSQPTVTRRSRIEHWPLLCLRALAIILLAIAFARPLWRTTVFAEELPDGKWTAVLLDTSASMRRAGLWAEAQERLESLLTDSGPADRVGVWTFDRTPRQVWTWDDWTAREPGQRASAVLDALRGTTPTWLETDLAQALIMAAESLDSESGDASHRPLREIVVITDFQSGSRLDSLHGHEWPQSLAVRVITVGEDAPTDNASLQPAAADDGSLRVRITNSAAASTEAFQIRWRTPQRPTRDPAESKSGTGAAPTAVDAVVPAGQSRIVRLPAPPPGETAAQLTLVGDDEPFDNTCSVVIPQQQQFAIVYLGSDDPADPAALRFFVSPLFSDTPQRRIEIIDWDRRAAALPAAQAPIRLVLLTEAPSPDQLPAVQAYLRGGGLVIHVLRTPEDAGALALLAGVPEIPAEEAEVNGFSLLTDIDFDHPALAPFADPKYSRFTTLHFWKHRRLDLRSVPALRTLARFDDGDLAVGELPVGDGRIVIFTSGWNRADSQLAVWSKFVPLMNGLLQGATNPDAGAVQRVVGDALAWQSLATSERQLRLIKPDGSDYPLAGEDGDDIVADAPGIYTIADAATDAPLATWAVNLSPSESNLTPLGLEQLEALGIPVAVPATSPAADTARSPLDLATIDLEQRQRLWRWVLLAVIGVLIVETAYAGWLTVRPT